MIRSVINQDLRGLLHRMGSSNTWIIFLVAFFGSAIEQSSSLPRLGSGTSSSGELEENLSAEKVLLPEVERNKTKDEGPDYLFEKEIVDRDHLGSSHLKRIYLVWLWSFETVTVVNHLP